MMKSLASDAFQRSVSMASESSLHSVMPNWRTNAVDLARQQVEQLFKNSRLEDRTYTLPKFSEGECLHGRFLGKGAFGYVHEVRLFSPDTTLRTEDSFSILVGSEHSRSLFDETEGQAFISKTCALATGGVRYAIKRLKSDVVESRELFGQGVANMVMEARLLSAVEHPHVIKLHAVAKCDPYQQPGFFLVMDLLQDTMPKRLKEWHQRHRRSALLVGALDRKGKKKAALFEDRLAAASGLSAALEYLHRKGIVHRDIKPDNIGFDSCDNVKLFDFSLAATLHSRVLNSDGTYNLTGMTGSLRYMAPEVALKRPYNASCDVYSFAILFWEMFSLTKPFATLTCDVFTKFVVNGDTRPVIPTNKSWPEPLKQMVQVCWSRNASERPSMESISNILMEESARLEGGENVGHTTCQAPHQKNRIGWYHNAAKQSTAPSFW